jgi:hypothetical protein
MAFGVCGALLIQQIHYWCMTNRDQKHLRCDYYWTWNTTKELADQIKCYDERTIKRVSMELREKKVLVVDNFNDWKSDRTLWYRIDYARLATILVAEGIGINYHDPLGHFYTTHSDKISQSIGTKTSSETSPEIPSVDFATQSKPTIRIPSGKEPENLIEEPPMARAPTSTTAILNNVKIANGTLPSGNNSKSAQGLWKVLVPRNHPSVGMMPELTTVQRGQLAHIAKAFQPSSDARFTFIIKNWIGYCKFVEGQSGLKKSPDVPSIGFLLKHVGEAMSYEMSKMQLIAPKKNVKVKVKDPVPVAVVEAPKVEEGDEIASAEFILGWKPEE